MTELRPRTMDGSVKFSKLYRKHSNIKWVVCIQLFTSFSNTKWISSLLNKIMWHCISIIRDGMQPFQLYCFISALARKWQQVSSTEHIVDLSVSYPGNVAALGNKYCFSFSLESILFCLVIDRVWYIKRQNHSSSARTKDWIWFITNLQSQVCLNTRV